MVIIFFLLFSASDRWCLLKTVLLRECLMGKRRKKQRNMEDQGTEIMLAQWQNIIKERACKTLHLIAREQIRK